VNAPDGDREIAFVRERGQRRPATPDEQIEMVPITEVAS